MQSKLGLTLILLLTVVILRGQDATLSVYLEEKLEFDEATEYSRDLLLGKLESIFSRTPEITLQDYTAQFGIEPKVTVLTKDITSTAPPMIALNLELSIDFVNRLDRRVFHSFSYALKGVGKTENKAYSNAFSRIKYARDGLKKFVTTSKVEVINYYTENCEQIVNEAKRSEAIQNYAGAIQKLFSIPVFSGDCYDIAKEHIISIYQKKQARECKQYISLAKSAVAVFDYRAAIDALKLVDPESDCNQEVEGIIKQIKERTQDSYERYWELRNNQIQNSNDLEIARLDAASTIASSYYAGTGVKGSAQGSTNNINIVNAAGTDSNPGSAESKQADRTGQRVLKMTIVSPSSNRPNGKVYTDRSEVNIMGFLNDPEMANELTINNTPIQWKEDGTFSYSAPLAEEENLFHLKLSGKNVTTPSRSVVVKKVENPAQVHQPESALVPVSEQRRYALVIGNNQYQHVAPLKNPGNDAKAMTSALEQLNFKVTQVKDATYDKIKNSVIDFGSQVAKSDVALFYYAGHGLEIDGKNYIVPVEAKIESKEDALKNCMEVDRILRLMQSQNDTNLNILILDACRNNPFYSGKRGGGGLARMTPPSGMLIAYATDPGSTASDGEGSNGLYTGELIKQMKIPQRIEDVFMNTRVQVEEKSNSAQRPWEEARLKGVFFLSDKEN